MRTEQFEPSRHRQTKSSDFVRPALLGWLVAAIALVSLDLSVAAGANTRAREAQSLKANDAAHLHRVHRGGEDITEEGQASGTLPGKVVVSLVVGATVEAKFTITTSAGTISGYGSGRPKGRPAEPSFAGTMTVTRGTGRYAHVHGHGGFYGTLNRSTYRMVVQTTGTLSY